MKITRRDFLRTTACAMAGFVLAGFKAQEAQSKHLLSEYAKCGGWFFDNYQGLKVDADEWRALVTKYGDGERSQIAERIARRETMAAYDSAFEKPTKRMGYFVMTRKLFDEPGAIDKVCSFLELTSRAVSLHQDWYSDDVYIRGISPFFDPIPSGTGADVPQYEITPQCEWHDEYKMIGVEVMRI